MRYSEAVKRYKLENKQRMLNSILEAAEKERTAPSAADNYGFYYEEDTERETKKKETITMRNTQINEVRSRKGGIIAAACAALLIGGGIAAFAKQGALPIDDIKTAPATAATEVTSSAAAPMEKAETDSASVDPAAVEVVGSESAVTADTSSAAEAVSTDEAVVTTVPETVVPETTASTKAKVTGKTTFNELYESSNTVYMGVVSAAAPQTLEMPDGTVKNVIRYTLGGNYFLYDIGRDKLREYHGAEKMILQEVNAGDEAQIKPGETAIFMTGEATLADINGGFVYDNTSHQLFNATYSHDDIALGMRDYMLNVILSLKDITTVTNWVDMLGEIIDDSTITGRDDIPTDTVNGISWNPDLDLFEANLNINPQSVKIREVQGKAPFTNVLGTKNSQKISGFDDVDIEITSIGYTSEMTAAVIYLSATPKNGLEFDPSVLYNLAYDIDSTELKNISWALNADATMISEGHYYPVNNTLTFQIMFDQAGSDGQMEFDLDTEFTFTINGIYSNGGSDIFGEYKFGYTYNPAAIATVSNAKVVTRETATNNY